MVTLSNVPGIDSDASIVRNIVVGIVYLVLSPVIIAIFIATLPLTAALAVGTNWRGSADKLAKLPGISAGGGIVPAVVAGVYGVVIVGVVMALPGGEDTNTMGANSSAATATAAESTAANTAMTTDASTQAQTQSTKSKATATPTRAQTQSPTPEPTPTPTPEPTPTETPTPEPTPTPTPEPTPTPTPTEQETTYTVRISYDGSWHGAVGKDGSVRSVDGSGTETFEVEGDPFVISANAQKKDAGSGELTVSILKNGEVIASQSTTAEYGVAQTSTSV